MEQLGKLLIQMIISGVMMGFVFSLIAMGLTIIWGVMNIINFAHGEFLMIGMFFSFFFFKYVSIDPLFSLPMVAVLLFIIGFITYHLLIKKVLQGPVLAQLVVTFGLSIFLVNLAVFLWSADYRMIENPIASGKISLAGIAVSIPELVASIGSMIIGAAVYWFIKRTKTGMAIQAISMDKDAAAIMGINTDRLNAVSFAVGVMCVGVAGALLSNFYYVFPEVGSFFGVIAFATVALGGFGSIEGAMIAGVIVGLAEIVGGFLLAPAYKYAIVFAIYLAVVLIKPTGLKGW
ncbi:MAG: High-affinity branched-chain amino acid transport system permease protein LivH [Syntrophorhabdus sp. PtaU1.Bin058]|nr:MAG: High-affinity branched-chain amino acid transport system permease protein LivH [Syntrophorhabdus sp. PtaU1.Bin058]